MLQTFFLVKMSYLGCEKVYQITLLFGLKLIYAPKHMFFYETINFSPDNIDNFKD